MTRKQVISGLKNASKTALHARGLVLRSVPMKVFSQVKAMHKGIIDSKKRRRSASPDTDDEEDEAGPPSQKIRGGGDITTTDWYTEVRAFGKMAKETSKALSVDYIDSVLTGVYNDEGEWDVVKKIQGIFVYSLTLDGKKYERVGFIAWSEHERLKRVATIQLVVVNNGDFNDLKKRDKKKNTQVNVRRATIGTLLTIFCIADIASKNLRQDVRYTQIMADILMSRSEMEQFVGRELRAPNVFLKLGFKPVTTNTESEYADKTHNNATSVVLLPTNIEAMETIALKVPQEKFCPTATGTGLSLCQ